MSFRSNEPPGLARGFSFAFVAQSVTSAYEETLRGLRLADPSDYRRSRMSRSKLFW
jgi:hypothetical protein